MKYRIILVAILLLLPQLAFALPTPQQIEEQVSNGNYSQAESLIREVIAAKPNSAKAHYQLGQVLELESDYKHAYDELTTAANLDKSLSFASEPSKFRSALTKAEINLGKADAPSQSNSTHYGRIIVMIFAITGVIIALMVGAFLWNGRRQKIEDKTNFARRLTDQVTRLTTLMNKIASTEIQLNLEDTSEGLAKRKASLASLKKDIFTDLAKVRNDRELIAYSTIQGYENSLNDISSGVSYKAPESKSTESTPPPPTNDDFLHKNISEEIRKSSYTPPPPQSTTTVINTSNNNSGGSGDGFVTGMMLGEMMNSPRSETIIEKEPEYNEPKLDPPLETSDDSERDRFSTDTIDTGSDDTFDSGSSSDFDSGSSDSFDSGGGSSDW